MKLMNEIDSVGKKESNFVNFLKNDVNSKEKNNELKNIININEEKKEYL